MKFCPDCGTELKRQKTSSSWEANYECLKCSLKVEISYGDPMGGSSDHVHIIRPYYVKD